MANLAIRGHKIRGQEVIEILEMLGGKSYTGLAYKGEDPSRIYCINNENNFIDSPLVLKDVQVFSLEKFLEKFPYKVGDKVQHNGATSCGSIYVIERMKWEDNQVKYIICDLYWKNCKCTVTSKDLQPYKEETMDKVNQMSLTNCDLDEVEIVLGDKFELKIREGRYYAIRKKLQYPKTYEECCKILGCKANHFFTSFDYNGCDVVVSDYEDKIDDLLQNFRKLRYARDAYWKIAGEQMGLGKPWEPDWDDENEFKYGLYHFRNGIMRDGSCINPTLLVFPTEEMRDAFLENFGYLIELCKELL